MTLEEKASLCSGLDSGTRRRGALVFHREWYAMSSRSGENRTMQSDHLGINNSIKAVCFPAGCATASSFNRDLVRKLGETLGEECQAEHVSTILGSAMNIETFTALRTEF